VLTYLKKHWFVCLLVLIFALGVFLRTYHFSDWLHFELDQARDAKVVDLAVGQGIGNLPLLGPKAAGSFLRLGPIFYYFEYLGAKIFGNTPAGIAGINLLFSVLTPPLFYLFVRRYFNRKISIALFFLFSVSLFLVMYSRFAWNPNSLPFFILVTLYGLLRAVDVDEKRKGPWLVISAATLTVATQLHFVAFLAIPLIALIFLLIKQPRIKLIFWLASVLAVITLYIPSIVNDFKTGGDNISEFVKVFTKKSSAGGNTLLEKAVRNYSESANGFFLIVTSYQKAELPKLNQVGSSFDVVCDRQCRENIYFGLVALLSFTAGITLVVFGIVSHRKEPANARKDFIILAALWLGVSLVLFTPIAYDFAPRFFLIVAGLPFIFLGLMLQFMEKTISNKKIFISFFFIVMMMLAISNLKAVKNRFFEMSQSSSQNFEIETDRILKEHNRVTAGQQKDIAVYMKNIYQENNYLVYVNSEAFYRRSLLYFLEQQDVPRDDFRNSQLDQKVYRKGNYFLVYPTSSNLESKVGKYLENYQIAEQRPFGTLTVIRLVPKEAAINADEQKIEPAGKPRSASGVPVRCRWNEIFAQCNPDEPLEEGEGN